MKVSVIHGPNLNLLGKREPDIYGHISLDSIKQALTKLATPLQITLDIKQLNHEGDIIEAIHSADNDCDALIINAAAYTHTSIAIRDALLSTTITKIEVHISNIHTREPFRHHSYIAAACWGQISGFGLHSYTLALQAIIAKHLPS